MSCNQPVDVVTIDLSREEAEIPPSLYGIFFEEITHSGDGGLYAEMIRNRGFENVTLPSGTVLKDGKAVAKPLHCYSNDSIKHFSIAWNDSLLSHCKTLLPMPYLSIWVRPHPMYGL